MAGLSDEPKEAYSIEMRRTADDYWWIFVALGCVSCSTAQSGSDALVDSGGTGGDADGSIPAMDTFVDAPSLDAARHPDSSDVTPGQDASVDVSCTTYGPDAGLCYANACPGTVHTLQDNRDRLIADLAQRKCTDSCTLWASLNLAERYIFLMDTAYFGAPSSRLYPPSYNNVETALDHATALYSINGPMAGQGVDLSGRGGNDYNRIYLGFDPLGACVMRNFAIANPTHDPSANLWQTSDDLAGPHAPFTQREMIFWYRAFYDLKSEGPQFHYWHQDSDFTQSGINQRLGVCGVTDRTLVESTIAFDTYHNSDPLGDYAGRGGYGWQIVDMYVGIAANWMYMPSGCPVTQPVNTDEFGGGTFAGMGPVLTNGACTATPIGDSGACAQ